MVKAVGLFFICVAWAFGSESVYERHCVPCHKEMPVKIDKFFYRYLLKYSSENEVKRAMTHYLKNPTKETSILTDGLINRFGVKKKTTLSDAALSEALDTYWETYKVFNKLK
ncbi:MAG: hypothetical protein LRY52_12280 [Sulfurospirillum cavolei]|nr:hypothetical protein [Sulfurospirillum cavolei]